VSVAVLSPTVFEERLARFLFERSEEARAVRVGEKETSEQAAIVERYADLFTRPQLEELRAAEDAAEASERERLYRLRKTCEDGLVVRELAEAEDAFENTLLAARVTWRDEEMPLRTAQARLAVLDAYRDREELGAEALAVSARLNDERRSLIAARDASYAAASGEPDMIARCEEEKQISLDDVLAAVADAAARTTAAWEGLRERWLDRLMGDERDEAPSFAHTGWLRRLSPLAGIYTKERCVPICSATLARLGFELERIPNIRLDLEDRPQKSPRACVIASDPPTVVHLITRAQGGMHDYAAFLHEAGHALHYAGCDPELPYAFRKLGRDHALTEIYSYIVESVSREPGWHAEHFGLSDEEAERNAEAAEFVEALLFHRYTAKLGYELEFWRSFPDLGAMGGSYAERLLTATGFRYPPDNYLADMDWGFYSADYLRAWIRAAQLRHRLRADVGEEWWRSPDTGDFLRELFREGTRPSSEEIAARLGFDPLDTGPLVSELTGQAPKVPDVSF
jgi:hypothetical protein